MSLWDKVLTLPPELQRHICALYGDDFPLEVRLNLAAFIEHAVGIANLDPAYFYETIVEEVKRKSLTFNSIDPYMTQPRLELALVKIQGRYNKDPAALLNKVINNIREEHRIVTEAETQHRVVSISSPVPIQTEATVVTQMNEILRNAKVQSVTLSDMLKRLEMERQELALINNDLSFLDDWVQNRQSQNVGLQQPDQYYINRRNNLMNSRQEKIQAITFLKTELDTAFPLQVQEFGRIKQQVFGEILGTWKYEQQIFGTRNLFSVSLDQIESWSQELADLTITLRKEVKEAEARFAQIYPTLIPITNGVVNAIANVHTQVTALLREIIHDSFIVEVQPIPVLKTLTKIPNPVTIRFLASKVLNLQIMSPEVTTEIINEASAKAFLKMREAEASGVLVNKTSKMELDGDTHQAHFVAHLRHIQIKNIRRRADRRGTGASAEVVTDEKFCFLFKTEFLVADLNFKVQCLSNPIVVITHGSQEQPAWATASWDMTFGPRGRQPFQVPERVNGGQIRELLNNRFMEAVGSPLTDSNLSCLEKKAMANRQTITFVEFCRERMSGYPFSFWEWFYASMKLIERRMKEQWADGSIEGFIDKKEAEDLLMHHKRVGTFLIRCSDSVAGGVTVAWLHNNDGQVFSLAPFICKELEVHSLMDKLNDLSHLQFLYPRVRVGGNQSEPSKPKMDVFGKYIKPNVISVVPSSGNAPIKPYVRPMMRALLPMEFAPNNPSSCGSIYASSSCPSSPFPSSPAMSHYEPSVVPDSHMQVYQSLNLENDFYADRTQELEWFQGWLDSMTLTSPVDEIMKDVESTHC